MRHHPQDRVRLWRCVLTMAPKRYKLRKSAVLALAAVALGGATIGIQASPTCQRYIEKYVERVIPHHYSKVTLARWAAWGKDHPNYHPPKRHPRSTPQETFEKVNFDCEVPPIPVESAFLLTPEPLPDLPLPSTLVTVATSAPPSGPVISLVNAPLLVPPSPSVGDVPEPGPWLYVLTGTAFLLLFGKSRRLKQGSKHSALSPDALPETTIASMA